MPIDDDSLREIRSGSRRMAADLDGGSARGGTCRRQGAGIAPPAEPQDWATDQNLWLEVPVIAHERWMRSPGVNGGRGFSEETIKVYGAMWGKFVRFCAQDADSSAVLANESAVRAFLERLHQERVDEALDVKPGQVRQRVRGRDAAGATRQARRYLQLLARLHDLLVNLGFRDPVLGNPALLLLDHVGEEPDRPLPAALPLPSQLMLRVQMGEATPARAEGDWRALRDRAIVELVVGSGITSRQLRHLKLGADHLDLQASPPHVRPVAARRNQPNPDAIPLSREAAHTLELWLTLRKERIPGDALFPANLQGEPMSASSLYRAVAASLRQAERHQDMPLSEHLGPRTLRHTFATRQLRAGLPPHVVQQWLGHRQPSSTAVYEQLVDSSGAYEPA